MIRADQIAKGGKFESYEFCVTSEFNQNYTEAVEDYHPRYHTMVHPALLINHSNATRSPSFYLPPGVADVHAKEEVEYISPGKVGETFRVSWEVTDWYERRNRWYQVRDVLITNREGSVILRRQLTDTYLNGKGYVEGRHFNDHLEGYVVLGSLKTLTEERVYAFSGGFPRGANWPAKNIHTDLEFARKCGLPTRVVSGAMFEGYLTELMIDIFGIKWLECGKMSLKFVNIVDVGDTLTPKAIIRSERFADMWCENQHGNKVVIGTGELSENT